MKHRPCSIFALILVMIVWTSCCGVCLASEAQSNVVLETPFVSHTRGTRSSSVCDYDATGDYAFFAYSEKISVVDAYDTNGNFAFSLEFDMAKNGSLSLRCEGGLLYVLSKNGNVFVFSGENMISQYTGEIARSLGYSWQWFESKTRNIKLIGLSAVIVDANGGYTQHIPLQFDVIWGIYSAYSIHVAIVFAVLLTCYRKIMKNPRK